MGTVISTPSKPGAPVKCEGLIMQIGNEHTRPDEALRIARQVVKQTLKGKWTVAPMAEGLREFEVGKPAGGKQPSVSAVWDMANRLEGHRDVASAEPALILPGADPMPEQVFPSTQLLPKSFLSAKHKACSSTEEWSLDLTSVKAAWGLNPKKGKKFGSGIVVGHPDTGYTPHPEIWKGGRVLAHRGYDFESGQPDPIDPLTGEFPSHGTGTASVIMSGTGLQVSENLTFVSGTAPKAKLVPYRVSTSVIHLSFKKVSQAIYRAIANKDHIISMSLGGPFGPRYLKRAIQAAIDNGIIVLAAAGNVWPFVVYPAKFDEVIAVAACNCLGKPWSGSARGSAVDVTAPGESVWRAETKDGNKHTTSRSNGTSHAVATTAGICALWLAYHSRSKLINRYGKENLATVFKEVLLNHGVDTPTKWKTNKYGSGIVNASKLLKAQLPKTPAAGGMKVLHSSLVPKAVNQFDEIMHYFPDSDPRHVLTVIGGMLKIKPIELSAALSEFGEELMFHVATNPQLRVEIAAQAAKKTPKALSSKKMAADTIFIRNASKRLRGQMKL